MLTAFVLPSRVLLARRFIALTRLSSGKMPAKRKADDKTKDDEKKNKGATDWDSLDFGSDSKTGENKVESYLSSQF